MASAEKFDFNAPQFVESLSNIEEVDDGADNFFDAVENVLVTPKENGQTEGEPDILTQNEENTTENIEAHCSNTVPVVSCDENVVSDGNEESISVKKFGQQSRLTRMSFKKVNSPLRRSARFTSLAEQVHKFHHATPPRFKRKSGAFKSRSQLLPTIAHSPLLQTKIRARPSTVHGIETEERLVFKPVKAPRLQSKPPPKPAVKPSTIPQPFNLTDPSRFKKAPRQESNIAEGTSTPVKKPVNVKKKTLVIEEDGIAVKEVWAISGITTLEKTNKRTKVVPFSFEQRNQEILKAKQKKLEEAKENKPENFKLPPPKPAPKFRPSSAVIQSDAKKKRLGRPSLQNGEKKLAG